MSLQCSRKYLQMQKLYCSEKFFTNIKYRKVVLILHLLKSWSLRPSDFAVNFIPHQDNAASMAAEQATTTAVSSALWLSAFQ